MSRTQYNDILNELEVLANPRAVAGMARAAEDLRRPPTFLADVKQSIPRCHEIESRAFEGLSGVVAESGFQVSIMFLSSNEHLFTDLFE